MRRLWIYLIYGMVDCEVIFIGKIVKYVIYMYVSYKEWLIYIKLKLLVSEDDVKYICIGMLNICLIYIK